MIRRDFFKTLLAATAGLAASRAGAALPSAAPPKPEREWEKQIAEMLKKCVVVGIQQHATLDGPTYWEVEYIYDPDKKWRGARLNDELKRSMPAKAGMRDVTVTAEASRASDTLFNDWGIRLTDDEPEYHITVTWVTA
jgi:hypothetical protein